MNEDELCVALDRLDRHLASDKADALGHAILKQIAEVAIQQALRPVVLPNYPDEDPKIPDLLFASLLLHKMAATLYSVGPPESGLYEPGAALIIRLAKALDDLRFRRNPPMFDFVPVPHPNRASRPVAEAAMGMLAAALEILIVGGMKPSDAIARLNSGIKKFGITDAAGQSISASRVNVQREHYREKQGAARSRDVFNYTVKPYQGLILSYGGPVRVVTAQNASAFILRDIAQQYNGQVTPKKGPRKSGRAAR
jgi:hypothetical protein